MDFLKEIICVRNLDGKALHPSLKIVAACNPYLKLPKSAIEKQEAMGLGFRNNDRETLDGIPLRHLVYRVSKLPDSILHHLWDFGSLTKDVESVYIQSIIDRESELRPNTTESRCFAALIQRSQVFTRSLKDESILCLSETTEKERSLSGNSLLGF
jgi:hypothetical protein